MSELDKYFRLCCLCFSLAMRAKTKELGAHLMNKHRRYAHLHRMAAKRMRRLTNHLLENFD